MQTYRKSQTPKKSPRLEQKYVIGRQLGRGQFGKVYRGRKKQENQEYAVKIIALDKVRQNPKIKCLLKNEIEILDRLKHPNIIEFYELLCDENNVYMIYELCDEQNLQDMLPIPSDDLVSIAEQIVNACAYAEKRKALHRDLKPANILFKNRKVKVADWGFSREIDTRQLTRSFIGSPAYMAPEVLKGSRYSSKADVWSFGVMIYQCYHGYLPWQASTIKVLQSKQKKQQITFKKGIPDILRNIILQSLTLEQKNRASFSDLKKQFERYENIENPEIQNEENKIFSEQDVRKCSFYLEYAKSLSKFKHSSETINYLSLQLIIMNLKQLRRQRFPKNQIQQLLQQSFSTLQLLNKEINLIKKLKTDIQSPHKKITTPTNCNQLQKKLISQLKKYLKQINISRSSHSASNLTKRADDPVQKQMLIWLISVIDLLIFDHLPINTRQLKLQETQKLLCQMNNAKLYSKIQKKLIIAQELF